MEAHLGPRAWLVGDGPTLADVAMVTYTAHAPEGGVSLEPYPAVRAWIARVEGLPGFVGMKKSPHAEPPVAAA
jgi:glutathione S-transferase